ncbi:UPF0481-like protein [Cinnamomum micranthum f. kanehirae]|uniref:UPF0481-like protein n=1 Tax=Cinnamomum micranthum f. kanehirae TaxID=337451 RepID=A0A443N815_9MAGN|nr:UPF0481-like protein [Cinnamomum micranthum f. kanehirae]
MAAETRNDVAAETSDDVAPETSNVETVHLSEERKNMEYCLIEIMKEHRVDKRKAEQVPPKRRIPKVDDTLRQTKYKNRCFEPLVVSFGPYHHGKEHLMRMEPYKNDAAAWFISHKKKKPAKDVADEEAIRSSSDEYIWKSRHYFNQASIARDMFLLENQIPFPILESLMSLLPDQEMTEPSIMKFIFMVFLPSYEMDFARNISRNGCFRVMIWIYKLFFPSLWNKILDSMWRSLFPEGRKPLHLLHVLREVFLGVRDSSDSAGGSAGYWNYYFRPIRELKAAGIQVRRSRGITLKHLKFKGGLINSHLEIPQIIVDDSTVARLLNLVAYEMCPDGPKDREVTSYICLLDYLIDHPQDVNELQKENILLNRLGSNKDVAILFKELAANLSPDSNAYGLVINGIKDHFERHFNNERVKIVDGPPSH